MTYVLSLKEIVKVIRIVLGTIAIVLPVNNFPEMVLEVQLSDYLLHFPHSTGFRLDDRKGTGAGI